MQDIQRNIQISCQVFKSFKAHLVMCVWSAERIVETPVSTRTSIWANGKAVIWIADPSLGFGFWLFHMPYLYSYNSKGEFCR